MSKLDQSLLAELFTYDPVEARLYWKNVSKYHSRLNGMEAGYKKCDKGKCYWLVKINGKPYKRMKIIYCLETGVWPVMLDHKDGNSLNDHISNLRVATREENTWNRKIGKQNRVLPMGIRRMGGGFQVRIAYKKKTYYLGIFNNLEDARQAYTKKREEFYGQFA